MSHTDLRDNLDVMRLAELTPKDMQRLNRYRKALTVLTGGVTCKLTLLRSAQGESGVEPPHSKTGQRAQLRYALERCELEV